MTHTDPSGPVPVTQANALMFGFSDDWNDPRSKIEQSIEHALKVAETLGIEFTPAALAKALTGPVEQMAKENGDSWRGIAAAMGYEPQAHNDVRPKTRWLIDRVERYRTEAARHRLASGSDAFTVPSEAKALVPVLLGHADYDEDMSEGLRQHLRDAARLLSATAPTPTGEAK